ncbi:MAG: NUDIX domain-containing protein [Actinobacteria bacterium]|uniref:Unannotated protein n=1 Tax=freshwater metagenome TaxID=449393 RepID=A0A6J6NIV5_9ZZZZ|nr:NUDIX domain-containing protein [Actinomycetota bacterium]
MAASSPSSDSDIPLGDVPDVLRPQLACVFCGINPGRFSAAAAAHFANPRNDFWRLLHDADFTPRLLAPSEQFQLLDLGFGVTNAAYRTTPGSNDLRRGDFDIARLRETVRIYEPRAIAFVGKEAYRGLFGERPEHGPQQRALGNAGLFVLPSTSPANAAVPYAERLMWFQRLRAWIEPERRQAVRALVVDPDNRVLLFRFESAKGADVWWATPGGGLESGEDESMALRRELAEEVGLVDFTQGPWVWEREHVFPWLGRLLRQHERFALVRVTSADVNPTIDLEREGIHGWRWWTAAELATTTERLGPPALATHLEALLRDGPPSTPISL